ncbi:MAG TPA: serine hydrolase [Planctomycetota bacterium]|nr:serine hydrolase [Planctomycetota bacterium]
MRRLLPLFLLATLARGEDALAARVDALCKPYVEDGRVVGMAVGIFDGREQVLLGYGAGSPGADTVYEIGSVSKVFTGVLLAGLVRDGVVRLDQPVVDLLPGGSVVPADGERKVTLLDLTTHTSGLPRMPDNFAPKDPGNPFADYTAERMLSYLKGAKLSRAPGTAYEYSNLGVGLLGWALAKKAGKGYEELLAERITGPLGMKSTAVALTPDMKARLAPGHDMAGGAARNWDIPALAGAGGIRSTAADMMRFLRANLAPDGPLAETLAFAREVRFEGGGVRMGCGWHVSPGGARWHNGQTGGYHSFVAVDVANGRAVVVLADTATGDVDELGGNLLKMLAGEKVETPRDVLVKPEILAEYAGTYALFADFKLTVTAESGRLMVQATGQQKFPVFAKSETEFFYKVVDAQITFERDKDGKVTRLVLHQNGQDMPGIRE